MNHAILIIDDDTMVASSLELLLKRSGYRASSVHRPQEALPAIADKRPSLVLLDMNFTIDTSGKDGMGLLKQIMGKYPNLPVIQMTGWATVQLAVEGMKAGAKDFIAKPWDNRELLNAVAIQIDKFPAGHDFLGAGAGAVSDGEAGEDTSPFSAIVGESEALTNILDQAKRVAGTQASVLITGESGTGKELVAEAIHLSSKRAAKAFIAVNLGGVPPALFESELFGHKAGAFTDAKTDRKGWFEMAEGGTLFLDEIGDLSPAAQVKLLRVLQERQYVRLGDTKVRKTDVRILSATSRDLQSMVTAGTFREDLLYRINLIHLILPPLRERPSDIVPLAEHFLAGAKKRYDRPKLTFGREAAAWLRKQPFPGNIRQLQNLVERTAILAPATTIQVEDMSREQNTPTDKAFAPSGMTLEEMEIKMIKTALGRNGGEIAATARELGLTRAALYRRLEKYDIG
ncbi:sigma-54-dependent transcriptional regulator [Neolewinella persica]|uniref:sigma-54-dependent transcriptional regulator n=1 Tax=Neolewinella persica TaxID=70998 RepID=UPI0003774E44|nr:sigma-54 dependent transcriptional regulator [Neolewinella persica]